MVETIKQQAGDSVITLNAPVTSIALTDSNSPNSTMTVTAGGQQHIYSHVISTLPMPNLRTIDLTGSKLDVVQANALRESDYGPSIKIGIRFSEAWWTTGQDRDGNPFNIVGGQSFTDLPIRTVVYPSYGVYSDSPPATLIASYCWTYDAERLGALIGTGQQEYEDQLKALVLADLATVHNLDVSYLASRFQEMYSWDWNHNPLTGGK
jgi:monoamine oxidase